MSCLPRNLKTLEEDFGELNEVSHLSEDKSATYFRNPVILFCRGRQLLKYQGTQNACSPPKCPMNI